MQKDELISVREGVESDHPFIYASWLKGLRYGNDWFSLIESDHYYKNYHAVIEHLLNDPNTTVLIACLQEDPDVILGFSVSSGDRLHWVFVKQRWRKIGIARSLAPTQVSSVSHLTDAGKSILKRHPGVTFKPFL